MRYLVLCCVIVSGMDSKMAFAKNESLKSGNPRHIEQVDKIDRLYYDAIADMNSFRPNLEDFKDVYDKKEIIKDLREVFKLETIFKNKNSAETEEMKKLATITEYLIFKHLKQWTDGNLEAFPTSEYDDYINKVDLILKYRRNDILSEDDHVYHAMKIDVVFGSVEGFAEKLMLVKKDIDESSAHVGSVNKTTPAVKYFRTDKPLAETSFVKGVISLSGGTVHSLIAKELSKSEEQIENDNASYIIMMELCEQYQGFKEYAEYARKPEVAKEYEHALEDVRTAFGGLIVELEHNPKLKEGIEKNPSVLNQRTFFKILKEEYMPIKKAA